MKKYPFLSLFLALFAAFSLTSCDKNDVEDPDHGDESETITTISLTYANSTNPADVFTATFKDNKGLGGNSTSTSTINLKANATYAVTVKLLDESNLANVKDIGAEVLTEAHDHQFFYESSAGLNLTTVIADRDKNNLPLGIAFRQQTGAASTGKLRVRLKHQPGMKTATSTVNTGDTDVDVSFDVKIQ